MKKISRPQRLTIQRQSLCVLSQVHGGDFVIPLNPVGTLGPNCIEYNRDPSERARASQYGTGSCIPGTDLLPATGFTNGIGPDIRTITRPNP